MARKMLRPYSILLYFLAVFVGFFLGVIYAGWIEAGNEQMLAAGTIVVGYGVMGAFIGLLVSLGLAYWFGRRTIIRINGISALLLAGFVLYFVVKYQRKEAVDSMDLSPESELPRKMTWPLNPDY